MIINLSERNIVKINVKLINNRKTENIVVIVKIFNGLYFNNVDVAMHYIYSHILDTNSAEH